MRGFTRWYMQPRILWNVNYFTSRDGKVCYIPTVVRQ